MSAMCIGLHNYTLWYGMGMVYDKDGDLCIRKWCYRLSGLYDVYDGEGE